MFYDLENKKIKNSGNNWIAPNATIIGDVILEKNKDWKKCYRWPFSNATWMYNWR